MRRGAQHHRLGPAVRQDARLHRSEYSRRRRSGARPSRRYGKAHQVLCATPEALSGRRAREKESRERNALTRRTLSRTLYGFNGSLGVPCAGQKLKLLKLLALNEPHTHASRIGFLHCKENPSVPADLAVSHTAAVTRPLSDCKSRSKRRLQAAHHFFGLAESRDPFSRRCDHFSHHHLFRALCATD